jgi:F-box/leucine-rich repeat protein 2/20
MFTSTLARRMDVTCLSDDVLTLIFEMMNHNVESNFTLVMAVPAVCRRWKLVCRRCVSSVWITMCLHEHTLSEVGLHAMIDRFRSVTRVDAGPCSDMTAHGLALMAQKCPKLVSFAAWGKDMTDSKLAALTASCTNLRRLDVAMRLNVAGAKFASFVPDGFPNLSMISLSTCDKVTDAGMASVAKGCPNINKIDLFYCSSITDAGLSVLVGACTNLVDIYLSHCCQITDTGLKRLAHCCPKLLCINLDKCERLTDNGLECLAKKCPNMTSLSIDDTEFTDTGLEFVAEHCRSLRRFSASRLWRSGNVGFTSVALKCSRLVFVDVWHNPYIFDDGFLLVLSTGCLASLERLCIADCCEVGDDGIANVAKGCPNLTHLNIRDCDRLTDKALETLETRFHRLERLSINSPLPNSSLPRVSHSAMTAFMSKRQNVVVTDSCLFWDN